MDANPLPTKRACQACRRRRTKCDRATPACSFCVRRSITCTPSVLRRKRHPASSPVGDSDERNQLALYARQQALVRQLPNEKGGNSYGDINLTGQATAVVGNIVNYNYRVYLGTTFGASKSEGHIISTAWQQISPIARFEVPNIFRPDLYTVDSQEATLLTNSSVEVARSSTSQTHFLTFVYRPDNREVIHVEVSLTATIQSRFWLKLQSDNPARNAAADIPFSLLLKLKNWLDRNKTSKRLVRVQCMLHEGVRFCFDEKLSDVHTSGLQLAFHKQIHSLTNTLQHSQCEYYYESEFARSSLQAPLRSCRSLVFHPREQKWVCEIRFSPESEAYDAQVYTLQVLHELGLRQCRVGTRFLGVVRDHRERIVAFLTDLPEKGFLANVLTESDGMGSPVGRGRRRKWCRQLLLLVAEVHRQCHVIGMLGLRFRGIFALDATDAVAAFGLFRPRALPSYRLYCGGVPPEFRGRAGSINNTPQSDLFQLGLALWRIAGNKSGEGSTPFCESVCCQTPSSEFCTEPHADPIALNMDPGTYDQDMIEIINVCRAEDPRDRLPAAQLLHMLSNTETSDKDGDTLDALQNVDLEGLQKLYRPSAGCDKCGEPCNDHYYHCEICDGSDFDICQRCFDKNRSCLNSDHWLNEYRQRSPTTRYYSHARADGTRDKTIRKIDDDLDP